MRNPRTITKSTWMEHINMVLVIILMVLLGPPIGAFAQQCTNLYEVGGVGNLWAPVPSNPSYYREWASSITFRSGDCIQFNRITTGYIYQLSISDYTTCFITYPSYYTYPMWYYYGTAFNSLIEGPIPIHQVYPVYYYLIEADFTSCTQGMKFIVVVVGPSIASPTPPPPSQSPPPPSPTPPPPTPLPTPPPPPPSPTPPLLTPPTPLPTPPPPLTTPPPPLPMPPPPPPPPQPPIGPSIPQSPKSSLGIGSILGVVFGIISALLLLLGGGLFIKHSCSNNNCCNNWFR